MKYICLGYADEQPVGNDVRTRAQRPDRCVLRLRRRAATNGHVVGGESPPKALGTPPPCDGRTARCPSPMARLPRRKSNWRILVLEARD